MAAKLETSQHRGSDIVYDVCCSVCDDDGIHKEGLFHCQKCSKYFCDGCVLMHKKLLKDHSVTQKGEGDNWPVTKPVDDIVDLCEEHTIEKLTMFCDDHEKLLCQLCLLHNHRQCGHIVLITEKIKSTTQRMDVAQMATLIEPIQKRLQDMVKRSEQNIKSLQASYERVLEEILDLRRQINENLDRLQRNTVHELEQLHSSLKSSLENDSKQCLEFISKLKRIGTKGPYNTSPELAFTAHRKCLEQTSAADLLLQEITKSDGVDIELQHNNDLEQFLAACTDLGKISSRVKTSQQRVDPNKVVSVQDKSQYYVRTMTDMYNCYIKGLCETASREFLIADWLNQCVKLLDQAYNVIEQIKLTYRPSSMCNVSSNEMAMAVCNESSVNEIQFLRVDEGKIVKLKELQLNHLCYGIAHHQDDLFVTSGTALYYYTIDGRLVKKLYQDMYGNYTVVGIAVNPDGKRIYVTDIGNGKLLTLTRDGAVTATLQLPAFKHRYVTCNIHVAGTGHVFVIGNTSISQVDTDGNTILNTIGVDISFPSSVFFSADTSKLLVGFCNNDNVIEFKTKIS